MKKLLLTIVQTRKIAFDDSFDEAVFSKKNLNKAAEQSLQVGGFVIPPTLLRVGDELTPFYHILAGHFQCYAARIARNIDPVKGETIPAIVIINDD